MDNNTIFTLSCIYVLVAIIVFGVFFRGVYSFSVKSEKVNIYWIVILSMLSIIMGCIWPITLILVIIFAVLGVYKNKEGKEE